MRSQGEAELSAWLKVRELFEAACELSPPRRQAFLAQACDDDAGLRAEVESLLECSERAPDFMGGSAAKAFPELFEDDQAASVVGRRLGPYRLRRLLASGGMGAVYLAVRADDDRELNVAVKLIKCRLVNEETLRRFRTERQTLGRLDHPYIARLLDGGVTSDGVPYLVMEYVNGTPIDRFCDERKLTTAQRLRLFLQVCSAVSYAHRNLVVHRDLKPNNVLVADDGTHGVPKLVDFGIAKVLNGRQDAADPTITAHRVMTPEYASPEQIRGEPITTASDVYSLGIILFELLTGRRPYRFRSRSPHEIERTICDQEPERPSTTIDRIEDRRRLSGDLDEIVLTALRKEPQRRYASVEQLAEDIRRHLGGLPVSARRASQRYRAAKFIRRHRAAVTAAAVIALLLVGAVVLTAWQSRQTRAEALKVSRVNSFLTGMLASVDTNAALGPHGAVRNMLDEATQAIEAGALDGQPVVEASVRMTVGMTYLQLGLTEPAQPHLEGALDIRRREFGHRHPGVAESLDALGMLARAKGELRKAERLYGEALEQRRELLGEQHADYAQTLNNLGVLLRNTGELHAAEKHLREALRIRRAVWVEQARGAVPDPVDSRRRCGDVATTLVNLAAVLKNEGRLDEAEDLYRESLTLFLEALGREHYRIAVVLNNLALLLTDRGRYREAEPLFREGLVIRRKVFGNEHQATATGLKNLALLLARRERYAEAEVLYREALSLGRKLPGDRQRLANTLTNLADLLASVGEYDEAEALCREALAIRADRPGHPRAATSMVVLARVHLGRDDAAGAELLLREAVAIYAAKVPAEDRRSIRAASELGRCLTALERFEEAESLLLESVELMEKSMISDPTLRRETIERIDGLYRAWGRPEVLETENQP